MLLQYCYPYCVYVIVEASGGQGAHIPSQM